MPTSRALEDVGSDVKARLADPGTYGQFVLSTLDSSAAMNEPDRPGYYGGGAEGYVDYRRCPRS